MRATIIAPNAWAATCLKFEAARDHAVDRRVVAIEHAVARMAGGFLQPVDRIAVLDAVRAALADACPPEFEPFKDLPGLVRALSSSLMKAWVAGIDLQARKNRNSRLQSMAALETEVLKRLPVAMRRPADLRDLALQRLKHAPAVLGDVRIVGRTEMSPVWRPFIAALTAHVTVTWDAGAREVPAWISKDIRIVGTKPASPRTQYFSCADGAHEALEAVRWAKDLIAAGRAKPEEIAICAAAPQGFDAQISSIAGEAGLAIHFIHGRPAVEGRDGQEACALADILVNGLSLQRFRRLGGLSQGPLFAALPDDWRRVLPAEAALTSLARWDAFLETLEDKGLAGGLREIVGIIAAGPEIAADAGTQILGGAARALWNRALLEGPADALLTSLGALSVSDGIEGLASVVWGHAASIASHPRPFVRMIGLNSGSWPRGISEDPMLPGHIIPDEELNPLPVADADRRDFATILACAAGEVVVTRSRQDSDGRLLGASPLYNVGREVVLEKSRSPERGASQGDRLAARLAEFGAAPEGVAARATWRNWHIPEITPHDGRIRPQHPLVMAALDRPMSASTIRLLLTNPIGWLFGEVMSLREPDIEEEPFELDALAFGNLVHGVIEITVRCLEGNGGLAKAGEEEVRAAVRTAAREVAAAMELQIPVPPARVWRLTVERAIEMAEEALLSTFFASLPDQKSWSEVPFGRIGLDGAGLPWNPEAEVRIGTARISGKVDRLDLSGDGKKGRVIDWKTGAAPRDIAEMIGGGSEVQRPVYAAAVRQLAGASEIEAGLAYLRGGADWHPLQDPDACLELLARRLDAMRAAAAGGLLVPGPSAGDDYDDYSFALPGDAKERYIREKAASVAVLLGEASLVWADP